MVINPYVSLAKLKYLHDLICRTGVTAFVQLARLFRGSNDVMYMKVLLAISSVCKDGQKEKADFES